jgi:hypothetical protein
MADISAVSCPKCQSSNIRKRAGWRAFGFCLIGAVIGFALSGTGARLGAGAMVLAISLSILAIPALIQAATSENKCLACRHRWR